MTSARCFVFAANVEEARLLLRRHPDGMLASGDREALALVPSERRVDLWQWTNPALHEECENRAWDFANRIAQTLRGRLLDGPCDLAAECATDLVRSFCSYLVIRKATSGAIRDRKATLVSHGSEMRIIDSGILPQIPADTFHAAVAAAADDCGVRREEFSVATAQETASSLKGDEVAEWANVRNPPESVDTICFSEGLGIAEQEWLLRCAADRTDWLMISTAPPPVPFPHASLHLLRWLPFTSALDGWSFGRDELELQAPLRDVLAGSFPEMFDSPHVAFLWRCFRDIMATGSRSRRQAVWMARALRPRRVVMGYDLLGPARCAVSGFRELGIPVLSIDHVGIAAKSVALSYRDTKTDLSVWGECDAETRAAVRGSRAQVHVVGSLRRAHAEATALKGSAQEDPKVVFLTATTSVPELMWAWLMPDAARSAWADIERAFANIRNARLVIKPHPRYDDYELYTDMASRNSAWKIDRRAPEQALADAAIAVLVNVQSTVAVDVLRRRIPLIYFDSGTFESAASPLKSDQIIQCHSAGELLNRAQALLNDAHARSAALASQDAFLQRVLAATGADAGRRALSVVQKLNPPPESPPAEFERAGFEVVSAIEKILVGAAESTHPLIVALRKWAGLSKTHRCAELPADASWGFSLMKIAAWGHRGVSDRAVRTAVLRALYCHLPPASRPSWRHWRDFAAETLDADSACARGRFARAGYRAALAAIAPKRVLRRKVEK